MDAEQWNQRYATSQVWSGEPNAALVAFLPGTAPGRALDLGCGEGADAIWLARRGWSVTALDWAQRAIERAGEHAAASGVALELLAGDFTAPDLHARLAAAPGYQLVLAAFLHPEPDQRDALYQLLPPLVAPGGNLLVIAHSKAHGAAGLGGPPGYRLLDPEDVIAALGPQPDFQVATSTIWDRNGQALDAVVKLTRA